MEGRLLEYLADFLDDENQVSDEILAEISHLVDRKDSELHIYMAKAAMKVYQDNVKFE